MNGWIILCAWMVILVQLSSKSVFSAHRADICNKQPFQRLLLPIAPLSTEPTPCFVEML